MITVLCAKKNSLYKTIPGVDVWDQDRDAYFFTGSNGMYEVKTFNRLDFDATGRTYRKPEDVIEVEAKWFDTEETGRIIKVDIKKAQLTLI